MLPISNTVERKEFPWVTWMLIIVNGFVFIFEISLPADLLKILYYYFGLVPALLGCRLKTVQY